MNRKKGSHDDGLCVDDLLKHRMGFTLADLRHFRLFTGHQLSILTSSVASTILVMSLSGYTWKKWKKKRNGLLLTGSPREPPNDLWGSSSREALLFSIWTRQKVALTLTRHAFKLIDTPKALKCWRILKPRGIVHFLPQNGQVSGCLKRKLRGNEKRRPWGCGTKVIMALELNLEVRIIKIILMLGVS
jgi:hypothetical protein